MDLNAFGYGILCMEEEYLDYIIKAIYSLEINSMYRLIIPDVDQGDFLNKGRFYPYRFYTFSYYVNEDQGNLVELKDKISEYYTNNDGPISNDQITAYNSIYLFKEVLFYIYYCYSGLQMLYQQNLNIFKSIIFYL